MALRFFLLLSVNYHGFLGKRGEWFPIAFTIILNSELSFSNTGCNSKLETNLLYLTHSLGRRDEFLPFPKSFVWNRIQQVKLKFTDITIYLKSDIDYSLIYFIATLRPLVINNHRMVIWVSVKQVKLMKDIGVEKWIIKKDFYEE